MMQARTHPDLQVLIVDDEPTQRLAVDMMCRSVGASGARGFETGEAALRFLDETGTGVDLVICDLDMPEMDGMEFVRRLAAFPNPPALMILSGHARALLDSVERLGVAYGLRMLTSVRKPLTRQVLDGALTGLADAMRRRPSIPAAVGVGPVETERALDGVFTPFFQPQIRLADGAVHGVEVLARLIEPDGRVVSPSEFMPELHDPERMRDFTLEIVDKTVAAIAEWPEMDPLLFVSINLSPLLFEDLGVTRDLVARIDSAGVPRDRLVFEIVETAVSGNPMLFTESAARLRLRGFGLAIDDYGQGHASLDQLRRLPFSELKIDRAFVAGIDVDADNHAIVANTIAMAKALSLRTIAEGVERREEARVLTELGCDVAQGFLYSPAVPAAEFLAFLDTRTKGQSAT